MTVNVEGPDGTIVEFPDGTPIPMIEQVMARTFGATARERSRGRVRGLDPLNPPVLPPPTKADPQDIADFVGTSLGAAAGIAAGGMTGPASPLLAPAGGAAGSVLGKRAARYLMGAEQPDLLSGETALDAAGGASGPVLGSVMRNVPKAVHAFQRGAAGGVENIKNVGRANAELDSAVRMMDRQAGRTEEATDKFIKHLTASEKAQKRAKETGRANAAALAIRETKKADAAEAALKENTSKFGGVLEVAGNQARKAQETLEKAVETAVKKSSPIKPGDVNMVSAAALVLAEPTHALSVLVGGHALRGIHRRHAKRLLNSKQTVEWLLNEAKAGNFTKRSEVATSLTALIAANGSQMTPNERKAVTELRKAIAPPPQDERGRFTKRREQ